MLRARNNALFIGLFTRHVEGRLRRTFAGVRITGLTQAASALQRGPVLFVANHCSWWDALLAVWLSHAVLRHRGYAWMAAESLRGLPFFAWVGAFGVGPGEALAGVRYACALLDRPGAGVWIFAQGRERPPWLRPLGFAGGSALIARRQPRAQVLPVGLRYEFDEGPRPWCHVAFGLPLAAGAASAAAHEAAVEAVLAAQQRELEALWEVPAAGRAAAWGAGATVWPGPAGVAGPGPLVRLLAALARPPVAGASLPLRRPPERAPQRRDVP